MVFHICLVGIGGFFGAICRYLATSYFQRKFPSKIPLGTIAVNLMGSFLLGYLLGIAEDDELTLFLGTGFMGAFTTFSTFNLEAIKLIESKEKIAGIFYIAITYAGGIILAFLGMLAGKIGKGA
ncbi:fluoride efflux transporter CrcB [Cytobacillus massiliigabonensis]|uniref:fluoride efflux transporter CrcB n=1 Tax=Cytobacillus massiliigabonensis TaxID=1871011 RepID=UPI000C81D0AC|nr:fluoride efflux transporter CrcB [Cytobacillus massiliigabonensis]